MVVSLLSSLSLSTSEGLGELGNEQTTTRAERAKKREKTQLDYGFFKIQNEQKKSWRLWVLRNSKRTNKELVTLGSGLWVI
ncbi:hypothetical protein COP2_007809 [Malus domestica]